MSKRQILMNPASMHGVEQVDVRQFRLTFGNSEQDLIVGPVLETATKRQLNPLQS